MSPFRDWVAEWSPWLAALGLGGERLFKLWSDYRDRRGDDAKIRLLDSDSIFSRANAMMDRYQKTIDAQDARIEEQDDEIGSLRLEVIALRERIAALEHQQHPDRRRRTT